MNIKRMAMNLNKLKCIAMFAINIEYLKNNIIYLKKIKSFYCLH